MADEETQQAHQVPTVEQQNPFGIHIPSEEDRIEEARRVAKFAEQRVLEQLAIQHPVVATVLAELVELREKLASKKSKKADA